MLTKFADHVRQQQMEDSASRLDRTIRYRESLSDSDAHGSGIHIPPPPPPVAPLLSLTAQTDISTLSDRSED